MEEIEEYINKLKEAMFGCSEEEKIEILIRRVRFWYRSSKAWRESYEEEVSK